MFFEKGVGSLAAFAVTVDLQSVGFDKNVSRLTCSKLSWSELYDLYPMQILCHCQGSVKQITVNQTVGEERQHGAGRVSIEIMVYFDVQLSIFLSTICDIFQKFPEAKMVVDDDLRNITLPKSWPEFVKSSIHSPKNAAPHFGHVKRSRRIRNAFQIKRRMECVFGDTFKPFAVAFLYSHRCIS